MKTIFTLKDLVKYVIFISIIYTLMIIIPSQKISTRDIVLIVAIISIGFIFIDCLDGKLDSKLDGKLNGKLDSFDNLDIDNNLSKKINTLENLNQPQIINEPYKSNSILKSEYVSNTIDSSGEVDKFKKQVVNKIVDLEYKMKELQSKTTDSHSIRYMNLLVNDLLNRKILDNNDIENIKAKINSKLITNDEIIAGLEKIKLSSKSKLIKSKTIKDAPIEDAPIEDAPIEDASIEDAPLESKDVTSLPDKLKQLKLRTNEDVPLDYNFINFFSDKVNQVKSEDHVNKKPKNIVNRNPDLYNPLGNSELNKWTDGYTMLNTDKWQVPTSRPPVCINTSPCKVCPTIDDTYPVILGEWDNSRKISNTEISKEWANNQVDPDEYYN